MLLNKIKTTKNVKLKTNGESYLFIDNTQTQSDNFIVTNKRLSSWCVNFRVQQIFIMLVPHKIYLPIGVLCTFIVPVKSWYGGFFSKFILIKKN